jgi:hypothetical protein
MTEQQFNELKELIQRIEQRQIELEKQVEYLAKLTDTIVGDLIDELIRIVPKDSLHHRFKKPLN